MRFHPLYLALILLALFLVGCDSATTKATKVAQSNDQTKTAPTSYPDGARRITLTELKEEIKKNNAFIVDVRNQASYDAGHIPGSKLIPAGEILNHIDELPKNKLIVTYCS